MNPDVTTPAAAPGAEASAASSTANPAANPAGTAAAAQSTAQPGALPESTAAAAAAANPAPENANPGAPEGKPDGDPTAAPAPADLGAFVLEQVNKILAEREAAAEAAKRQAELTPEQQLEALKQELAARDLKDSYAAKLKAQSLPAELLTCLNLTSEAAAKASLEATGAAFNAAVQTAVAARLKTNAPGGNGGAQPNANSFIAALTRG